MTLYFETLSKDKISTEGTSPFIRQGNKKTKSKPSTFVNGPMGQNKLAEVGKEIAQFLGYENWRQYTGHCFRRSAATALADGQASTMDLRSTFGWKNEKTASTYVANSASKLKRQAEILTGTMLFCIASVKISARPSN